MHFAQALVSIKDFSYLNVFSLLNPGNVGQNSEIAHCAHHVYKAALRPPALKSILSILPRFYHCASPLLNNFYLD